MGKRYYCEYCDRSFMDSANNRKKHINGVMHQRQRKLHYDQFRDAATVLAEEKTKNPCIRLRQAGYCEFGSSCRYSHLTPEDIVYLTQQASLGQYTKKQKTEVDSSVINAWLSKVTKKTSYEGPKNADLQALEDNLNCDSWNLPDNLQNGASALPPSLLPPTIDDFVNNFSTWG